MSRILVIAYGNPLRGDDGVAWQAAEELKRESPRSTQVMCVHQLTPELAETASCADIVVFLDAARDGDPGGVTCQTVCARPSEMHFSHHLAPGEILALCDRLYSTCPHAFLISIHGKSFEHSGELTPAVISAIPQAVALVHELVKQLAACEQPITNIWLFKRGTVHAFPEILQWPVVFLAIDTPRCDPKDIVFVNPKDGTPESFIQKLEEWLVLHHRV